jgi:hypothetical protein
MSTDYKVVKESSSYMLERSVKRLIEQGYTPVGSMSVVNDGNLLFPDMEYCQAMIKEDD